MLGCTGYSVPHQEDGHYYKRRFRTAGILMEMYGNDNLHLKLLGVNGSYVLFWQWVITKSPIQP